MWENKLRYSELLDPVLTADMVGEKQWEMQRTNHLQKNNYFNWRLITLQYCGGFCHTST